MWQLCVFIVFFFSFLQSGLTPVMLAAEQGSVEIVQELIRRGANVNLDDVVHTVPYSTSVQYQ